MRSRKRDDVAGVLQHRIANAVVSGALVPGDRLPSTRELSSELGVDPRVIAAAYRDLRDLGLVKLTQRSGVYLTDSALRVEAIGGPSSDWLAEVIVSSVLHGCPVAELAKRVTSIAAQKMRNVVVIAVTIDQALGLAKELHDDFGFETSYILLDGLKPDKPVPRSLLRANLLVTTEALSELVSALALKLKKRALIVRVRPDVIGGDWLMLMQRKVYLIAIDVRFLALVKTRMKDIPGVENLVALVAGHDDLSRIPEDAPTYVTEAARRFLGKTHIPGRLIEPTRLLDEESVRSLAGLLVNPKAKA